MGKKHREIMWKRKGRENQTQARQPLLVLFGLSCHQVFPRLGAEALSGWRHAHCVRGTYMGKALPIGVQQQDVQSQSLLPSS